MPCTARLIAADLMRLPCFPTGYRGLARPDAGSDERRSSGPRIVRFEGEPERTLTPRRQTLALVGVAGHRPQHALVTGSGVIVGGLKLFLLD